MLNKANTDLKGIVDEMYSQPIVAGMITLFLVLYGGLAVGNLPEHVMDILNMPMVKVLMLGFIAVLTGLDTANGVLAAVAFVLTMNMLKKYTNSYFTNDNNENNEINEIDDDDDDDNNVSNNMNSEPVGISDDLTNQGSVIQY